MELLDFIAHYYIALEIFSKHYNLIHFGLAILAIYRSLYGNQQRSMVNLVNEGKINGGMIRPMKTGSMEDPN